MTKDRYRDILEDLLREYYGEIKVRGRASESRKHFIDGYMKAARALGALTHEELRDAVERVHVEVFGETLQERRRSAGSELSPEDDSLDIPAYVRQGVVLDQ